jgi:hypothetical protein
MFSIVTAKMMSGFVKMVKKANCTVVRNRAGGFVEAKDGETVVLRGLQTSKGGNYIAKFVDTNRVKWLPEGCYY